ncbi:MAG: hypothetical protein JWM53_6746 [bacterium]|nr:hypothetical protein [bacterium]
MRRRAILLIGATLLLGSACSSRAPVQAADFSNGKRLAVRYDEAPGGLKIFRAFYDTKLDQECQFRLLPDGARCLPTSAWRNGWFADAACTEALAQMPTPASLDLHASAVVDDPVNACEQAPIVRELGERIFVDKAYQISISDGSCVLLPVHGAELHRIGAELPIERFVHADLRIEPVSDAVGAVVMAAEDGSRQTAFGYDQLRGEWSYGTRADDGKRRWWPVHVAFNYGLGSLGTPGTVYDDSACAQPLAVKEAHNALCPITSVVEFGAADACGQYSPRIHVAGATVAADSLYERAQDGSCHAITGGGDSTGAIYVEMLELVPTEMLPEATVVDVGDGRIVERFDGTPGGIAVAPQSGQLFDRERGVACTVVTAADGQRRCLPPGPDSLSYSDPNCANAMYALFQTDGCAVAPAAAKEVSYQGRAFPVVGALSPSLVYSKNADGACVLVGPSASYNRWFKLGDEIPSSAFAPIDQHTN